MFYKAELTFLQKSLQKLGLQALLLDPHAPLDPRINLGLGKLLGSESFYDKTFYELHPVLRPKTVYNLCDDFSCRYLFFLLPDMPSDTILFIGPYLTKEISHQSFLELAETNAVNPRHIRHLEKYYSMLPYIPEYSHAFVFLESFYDVIWGVDCDYHVQQVSADLTHSLSPTATSNAPIHPENMAWNSEIMEQRYAAENMLMDAVASGQSHKIDALMAAFSSLPFEKRVDDPVRNLRNYSIIMNTLLRKAAEKGGVHPVFLDSTSSAFARKIETRNSLEAIEELMKEMYATYCHLVQKHKTRNYSAPIQHVILAIDSNLSEPLSLQSLAESQNLSAGYLSALFHKETGMTLIGYINQRRTDMAKHLLTTTSLQVQTIAQHCGIMDVHYFSKMFKKNTGMTPKSYREKYTG